MQRRDGRRSSHRTMARLFGLALMLGGLLVDVAETASGQSIELGSERWKILCGSQGMLTNVTHLPSIGCFRVAIGRMADGEFAGHVLTVTVNEAGEACRVDGAAFDCSGCIDGSWDGCDARLTVHSREPDGSINFVISRKFDGNAYVSNQENFDYAQKRLQSREKEPPKEPAAHLAQTPLPSGPYSSWPEESRKKAIAALYLRCAATSVMQLANFKGPKDAGVEMGQAMYMACVDHQMPDDWPHHADVQKIEREHFQKAKQLDPSISWSPDAVWREIGKR